MTAHERSHQAAADWLQRLDSPDLKEDDIQSWLEWFAAADSHRRAFEELQSLRTRLRAVPAEVRTDVRARLGLPSSRPALRERVGVRGLYLALAATFAIAAISAALWWVRPGRAPQEIVYTAPADKHRTVALEDGSTVVLGADAAVAVHFSPQRRSLDIRRGEAYFEVRGNPGRPFVVEAGSVRVTALGTAFNVIRDADRITVTVTEGVVEVRNAGATSAVSRIAVGQRAVLPLDGEANTRRVFQADAAADWQNGRADFVNAPLDEVLRFVNRYAPKQVTIDDPRVADLTYSGTILREHLDEWIVSLPRVYAVRAVPLEDGNVALVTRAP